MPEGAACNGVKSDIDVAQYEVAPLYRDLLHDSEQKQVMYNATVVANPPVQSHRYQILASVIASSIHVVVGCALAYSAILIPQLEAPESDLAVTPEESSWLASCLGLVVPIGALFSGISMESWGRLNTIKLAAVPCVLGWAMISAASSFSFILIGRLLTGISAGMGTSAAVVYITEVASPQHRGALVCTGPTLTSFGMVLVYLESFLFSWRIVGWSSIVYATLPVIAIIFYIPESPVWLVAKGRIDEADRALQWLAGRKSKVKLENPVAASELERMVKSQDMKALVQHSFWTRLAMFTQSAGFKPLILLIGLFFFQQGTGVYITLFYAITFFEDVGISIDASLATLMVGCVRLLMSIVNLWVMKSFHRRPLLMFSAVGMALCMTVSGSVTRMIHSGSKGLGWIPVICILTYVCFSMVGVLSIPWSMTAELFPTSIRGMGQGLTLSAAWVFMFFAVRSYRSLLHLFGGADVLQWVFAAMALAGCLFVWIFMPETHNKTLAQIEEYFQQNTVFILKKKTKKEPNAENEIEVVEIKDTTTVM